MVVSPHSILKVLAYVYASMLRPVLKKAIDNPDTEWDDLAMELADRIFGFAGDVNLPAKR